MKPEAAKLLGVGRRTIMGYLKKDELPAVSPLPAGRLLATSMCLQPITCPLEK